jgi:hypothetical protein
MDNEEENQASIALKIMREIWDSPLPLTLDDLVCQAGSSKEDVKEALRWLWNDGFVFLSEDETVEPTARG